MNDIPLSRMVIYTTCVLLGAGLFVRASNIGILLVIFGSVFLQSKNAGLKQRDENLGAWQIFAVFVALAIVGGIAIHPFVTGNTYTDAVKESVRIAGATIVLCVTGWLWWKWSRPN